MILRAHLVALAIATALAACTGPTADDTTSGPVAAKASAIVNGSTDTTRPEVLLLQDDTLSSFRCTATLIAPNLVVTARHCVGKRSTGTTLCKGGPTDEGANSLPSYAGDVAAAPMFFSSAPGAPIVARAVAIYDDGSSTACAHDIALIGLDRNVEGITPAQVRRTPVAVGDALVSSRLRVSCEIGLTKLGHS